MEIDIGATEVVSTVPESGGEIEIGKIPVSNDFEIDEMEVVGKESSKPSPKKKRGDGTDEIIDEDNNVIVSSEDKENVAKRIKEMTRKELEDLVLLKVVQAVVTQSEAGKMRIKMLELQSQKDKIYQRVGHLQKQVQEMSRALKLLVDNHNRDPNNLNRDKPQPPPIKFFRSVGLQVATEPAYRNGPTKIIHVNHDTPVNGMKPGVNINGAPIITVNGQQRMSQGSNNNTSSPSQVVRVVNGQSSVKTGGVLKTITRPANSGNSNSPKKTVVSPTIVDLTDEPGVVTSGSVQYRIVNSQPSSVQMIPTSQSYHLVNSNVPGGGLKPVFLTTTGTSGQSPRGVQTFVVRNVAPKPTASAPGTFTQTRPSVTRPNVLGPKVAATINTSNINKASPTQQIQPAATITKKPQFTLPPLPPSGANSTPKAKTDKDPPARPILTLNEQADGIVLSWTMKSPPNMAEIASYQLYACQEPLNPSGVRRPTDWKKVGDVKALPLPMACTLSQFAQGNRYFFIVRAVDQHSRTGPFCEPTAIVLDNKAK